MTYQAVLDDGKDRFEKTLSHLKDQLRRIRTGRATTALVDNVRVDYYGTPTPISQLAAVSIPEPRQILIKPFDASILKELPRGVHGLRPVQGHDINVPPAFHLHHVGLCHFCLPVGFPNLTPKTP